MQKLPGIRSSVPSIFLINMNKLAIVGHPASGYREVEALLHQCGMAQPRRSRREGMLPQDITATLCKAYKSPALDTIASEEDIRQIEAGSVWHGMALDLVLGNLDQSLWGWADPKTVFALDYWLSLDPQLGFVFVYDEPHRALMEAAGEGPKNQQADGGISIAPLTERDLSHALDNWTAVNGALLRFYLRHPERCLLVHAGQTTRTVDRYLQQLQPLLDESLVLPTGQTHELSRGKFSQLTTLPIFTRTLTTTGVEPTAAGQLLDVETAELYLVDAVLKNHPSALQLYAELQSVSNIPQDNQKKHNIDAFSAWTTLMRQRAYLTVLFQHVQREYERVDVDLTRTRIEAQQLSQQVRALTDTHVKRNAEIQAENDLLLHQLRELHEELERLDASTQAENDLLLTQLNKIQEQLEHYYHENRSINAENQKLKNENQIIKAMLPPPPPPGPLGAGDRVRRQLNYRLGNTLVQRSGSLVGWLGLPCAIWREIRAFRKEQLTNPTSKLPPLREYLDAEEAQRVKQHLSYYLGVALVKYGRSPLNWPLLPFALLRARSEFRRQDKEKK
ncbi:MAG: hypothetical protein QJR04_00390 [Burkholderia multivorans]|nr:hypothetical protein [Burkholderia multivorans]